jgi:gas vesicle protein
MDRKFSLQDFGIGVLTGLAAGAIAGILFAPDSGELTRERLILKAGSVKDSAQDLINNAINNLELAGNKLDGVFGVQEKSLRKRLGELKEELDKYNLTGA